MGSTPSLPAAPTNVDFAAPLSKVSYQSLYSFKGQPDGQTPNPDLIEAGGALYGTTTAGGTANFGTLFKITTGGSEAPIYSFTTSTGATAPDGGVIESGGTFFGTTSTAVFAITKGTPRILHTFAGLSDGFDAQGPVVLAGGKLYGATQLGGLNKCNSGCGTLFDVTPAGTGQVLYKFHGGRDGEVPTGSLIDVNGTLYGTTSYGGAHNEGTVFKISPSGNKTVLYNFAGDDDGSGPSGNLLYAKGTLYGAARYNGVKAQGTIFSLNLRNGKFTLLHGFLGSPKDGGSPNGGLVIVNGTIYGTTVVGGHGDNGTVFSITRSGKENILYEFKSGNDGQNPQAGLVHIKGKLYGTTFHGGKYGKGTIFKLSS
jgi:uncharacterized repeat protein (TIGR03803 family)